MGGIVGFIIGVVVALAVVGIRQYVIKNRFERDVAFAQTDEAKDRFLDKLVGIDKDVYAQVYDEYLVYLKKMAQENPKRIKLMQHYEQGLGFVKVSFYDFLKYYKDDREEVAAIKKEVVELTRNPEFKGFPYVEEPLVD